MSSRVEAVVTHADSAEPPVKWRPLVEELTPCPDVLKSLQAFAKEPGVLLLESVRTDDHVGRYSFLTADPVRHMTISRPEYGTDPFESIRRALKEWPSEPVPGLPPFQGGVAGLLSYELGGCWERLPIAGTDEFQLPVLAVGLYDWVLAWDHVSRRCWIISQGVPKTESRERTECATRRLHWIRETLNPIDPTGRGTLENEPRNSKTVAAPHVQPNGFCQWPLPGFEGLFSSFSREGYLRTIERVIEYIRAGDIFQANVAQRLLYRGGRSSLDLYSRLRRCNPAPFAAYYSLDDWCLVSASPERFVCLREREVETRPIKGTRQRHQGPEADLFARDELRQSEKDQAENVMIVDLLRNDLSRVCEPGSVRVPHLCAVEMYETVQHLVSEIRGVLSADADCWDLLRATFPGGSITGAPKVRAMEIIAELEPTVRGPYCGSLFYVSFDGTMDSNILIRTFICRDGWIQCPVGGGIVAQSDPVAEYEETLHKAEGMLRAL